MKRLKYNFVAKTGAVFLYSFAVLGLCFSGAYALGAYVVGFYSFPRVAPFAEAMEKLGFNLDSQYVSIASSVYGMRYWSLVIFVVALILFIVTFIFLMCAAGHKEGYEEIHLSFFDRVPLDIVLAIDFFLVFLGLNIMFGGPFYDFTRLIRYYGYNSPDDYIVTAVAISVLILLAMLILLAFFATFAARVKAGKWWQGSMTWFVLHAVCLCVGGVWRWLVSLLRAIPVVWKTAVIAAGFLIANFFLTVLVYDYDGALFFLFVLDVLGFCAAVLAAFQMKKLKEAGEKLAAGDFDHKTDTRRMFWDFKRHAENLNSIGDGMSIAVDQRMRSERLKTELITNVSHDIKTPLTSIVNYVDLLQKSPSEEEREKYLEVLARQAARLKKLTEDLVEASKASTGNIAVELVPTNTGEILNQALAEYAERLSLGKLTPIYTPLEHPVSVMADGRLLWRVLDNLLSNAVKYAQAGTRVYIDIYEPGDKSAVISVKNISRDRLNVSADELMERFVRGDSARSTSGSGLGLNIAKSLVELMGGAFSVTVDGDLFKAEIRLKTAE